MTRALITGLSGMVGSHLADYLLEHTDWDIHGMIRWRSPLDNLENVLAHKDRLTLHYADLRDEISVRKMIDAARPDYVFHLAAQSFPRTSFDAPLDTIDTNTQGTLRLLEALRSIVPKAMIHVCSSSEVYGKTPAHLLPIKEDCPFHPASPYAISKVGADLVAQHYAEAYGMNILVTRMFTHTGPRRGDVFAESSFAKQIAMIEVGLIPPVIRHGNLASLRTVADVRDAVRAYHMLLTINPIPGAVYNIGGSHSCTIGEILTELIATAMATNSGLQMPEFKVDPTRMRPIDADNQVPDYTKFEEHTGWAPGIPFERTMRDLLDYWRARVKTDGSRLLPR